MYNVTHLYFYKHILYCDGKYSNVDNCTSTKYVLLFFMDHDLLEIWKNKCYNILSYPLAMSCSRQLLFLTLKCYINMNIMHTINL